MWRCLQAARAGELALRSPPALQTHSLLSENRSAASRHGSLLAGTGLSGLQLCPS